MATGKLNKVEELKRTKAPLSLIEDIYRWAEEGFDAIPPDHYDLFKWHGFFYRKQTPGYFMLRLRIPNGILTTAQLRTIAELSRDVGRGVGDITTRQNIQLRWITIEQMPAILERLHAAGLGAQQTGMDNFRNVVGCPVTGLNPDEVLETRSLTTGVSLALLGPEFANLPRKLNIAINGCRHDCTHALTNDVALTPAVRVLNGRSVTGFNVAVGGHQGGKTPHLAQPLDLFVRPMQVTPLCRAILTVFRDHGSRVDRKEARLYYLIAEWGLEKFRAAVIQALGESLPGAGESLLYPTPNPQVQDHMGVHPQRQPGLSYVGLVVPAGRVTAEQLFALADLADEYGSREVRLTNEQNVIIPNVLNQRLPELLAEPLLQSWRPGDERILRGLSTCTGKDYCHFALNDTKGLSLAVVQRLEARFPDLADVVRINVSGCIHACGRHRAAPLGLCATRIRRDGEIIDGFDVFVGGQMGEEPRLGECVAPNLSVDETVEFLAQQIATRYSAAQPVAVMLPQRSSLSVSSGQ